MFGSKDSTDMRSPQPEKFLESDVRNVDVLINIEKL